MKKSSCCKAKLIRRTYGRKWYFCEKCGYVCDEKTKVPNTLLIDL